LFSPFEANPRNAGGLVNEQKLAELPLNGRNYLDLTLLQPGISQNTVVIQLGGGAGGQWDAHRRPRQSEWLELHRDARRLRWTDP